MFRIRSVLAIMFLLFFSAPVFAQFLSSEDANSVITVSRWGLTTFLSNPNGFYLLLLIGFYSILYEFTHGGFGFAGLLGILLFSLAVVSFRLLPVNWLALFLILIAIGLFLWEAFMPGNGFVIVAGIVLMGLGSLYLFNPMEPPIRVAYSVVFILTLLTAFLTIFLVRSAIRAHGAKVISGKEGLIGLKGEIWADIVPGKMGKVSAQGTLWNAVSEQNISKGEAVEVVGVDGMVLKVRRIEPEKKGA